MNDILTLLSENPHILDINSNIDRNQGSYTSYANDPPIPPLDRSVSRSYEIKEKAEKLIPGLTQTFSKGPLLFIQDVAPVYLTKAEGSHTWDVDGNEYIDYPMALGPVILGHNYPDSEWYRHIYKNLTKQEQESIFSKYADTIFN